LRERRVSGVLGVCASDGPSRTAEIWTDLDGGATKDRFAHQQ